MERKLTKVTIYTDGACSGNPGPGGYAAILICGETEKEIAGGEAETTNNRMELTGAVEALKALKTACEVDLYTDSTYVANAFLNGWIYGWEKKNWMAEGAPRKNADLWQELLALSRKHTVKWNVVKGHADNEYNNRCDRLAVAQWKKLAGDGSGEENESRAEKNKEEKNKEEYTGDLYENIVSSKNVFSGKVFEIDTLSVTFPDGRSGYRELIRHNGGAGIVAVDDEGYVLAVEQYRTGAGKVLLEIPAGKIEKGEAPEKCAKRELAEETGCKASEIKQIATLYATPGYCSEKIYLYLATGLKKASASRDEDEFLRVKKIHLDDFVRMVMNGEIEDGKTAAGILMAKNILG